MFNDQRREVEISSKSIFYLVNESNVGDNNTAKAIARRLEKSLLDIVEKVSVTEINTNDLDNIKSTYTINEDFIFIGSGAHNLVPLAKLSDTSAVTIWTCHQLHSSAIEIINNITLVAIPEHEVTEEMEMNLGSTTLVKTVGVAHGRSKSDVLEAYNNSEIPNTSNYKLLVLGGDAPDKDGNIKCFSQDAAAAISKYVDLAGSVDIVTLLTNCHRTGKHDPNSFECINRHTQDDEIDIVTRRALDSFSNEQNLLFYDYKTGSNYYLALLGAVCQQEESLIFIPGESTSMISEVISLLPASRIYIYDTDSMNESHHLHINSIKSNLKVNHLKLIDNKYELSRVDESISATKSHYDTCKHITDLALPIITGNKLNPSEENDTMIKRSQI